MKSFKNFITEGLVKIDTNAVKALTNVTMINIIQRLNSIGFNPDVDDLLFNLYMEYANELRSMGNLRSGTITNFEVDVDVPQYNIKRKVGYELINRPNSGISAAYVPEDDVILFNMTSDQIAETIDFFINNPSDKTLQPTIRTIETSVEHELTHAVENAIRQSKNAKELEKKKGYDSGGIKYRTSEVELEAQLKNLLNEFRTNIMMVKNFTGLTMTEADVKRLIKYIVGETLPNRELFTLHPNLRGIFKDNLLKELKTIAPAKYRTFLNKFYIEARSIMSKLKDSGFIV